MAVTQIADLIVPEVFTPYVQNLTEEKSRLIQSGAIVRSTELDTFLAGGGATETISKWNDLNNEPENISNDDSNDKSVPSKTAAHTEVAVRLNRNKSWSAMDLSADLAGADPMVSIANRVSNYWVLRQQALFVATMKGIFADNDAAPIGTEHILGDLTNDLTAGKTAAFSGATAFSGPAVIDAVMTMGDSFDKLSMIMVHSIVFGQMKKANMIEFIEVSDAKIRIATYLGRIVITDDGMPASGGFFESWLFGAGACRYGIGSPKVPTEIEREASAGGGGGQEILHNRVKWALHPNGHSFTATPTGGGPSNEATSGNIAHADTWKRNAPERKQVNVARLITREF